MADPVSGFRLANRETSTLGHVRFPSDTWAITTGSAVSAMPNSRLQTDMLADTWTAVNHRSSCTWIQAAGVVINGEVKAIGLLGMNRKSPTVADLGTLTENTIRLRVDTYALADRVRPPFTISSKVNLTGADANLTGHSIDPPDDPAPAGYAETKLTPTNPALPTSIIGTWANYYGTERELNDEQILRVHLSDANDETAVPVVTISVYQGGVPAFTPLLLFVEKVSAASSSGGFIFNYTFNATDLTSHSGVMELHLSTATACDFIGLELIANHSNYLYDSGPIDYTTEDLFSHTGRPDLTVANGTTVYVHVELSDFCWSASDNYSIAGGGTQAALSFTSIVNPGQPDGRFRAGRFIASDAAIFPISSPSFNLRPASTISPTRTRSGSIHGTRAPLEWMEGEFTISCISRALLQKLDRMVSTLGLSLRPTLLIPDPLFTEGAVDDETKPRLIVITSYEREHIGRLSGITDDADSDGLNHTHDRWNVHISFMEHNGRRAS